MSIRAIQTAKYYAYKYCGQPLGKALLKPLYNLAGRTYHEGLGTKVVQCQLEGNLNVDANHPLFPYFRQEGLDLTGIGTHNIVASAKKAAAQESPQFMRIDWTGVEPYQGRPFIFNSPRLVQVYNDERTTLRLEKLESIMLRNLVAMTAFTVAGAALPFTFFLASRFLETSLLSAWRTTNWGETAGYRGRCFNSAMIIFNLARFALFLEIPQLSSSFAESGAAKMVWWSCAALLAKISYDQTMDQYVERLLTASKVQQEKKLRLGTLLLS